MLGAPAIEANYTKANQIWLVLFAKAGCVTLYAKKAFCAKSADDAQDPAPKWPAVFDHAFTSAQRIGTIVRANGLNQSRFGSEWSCGAKRGPRQNLANAPPGDRKASRTPVEGG
jgi:hypothetical protein